DPMCIGINPQRARTYNFLCRPRRGEVALARKAPVRPGAALSSPALRRGPHGDLAAGRRGSRHPVVRTAPTIAEAPGLGVSLPPARGHVASAAAPGVIGVDIEPVPRDRRTRELAVSVL